MDSALNQLDSAFANIYSGWILWNLFLALIPLMLSFWLFRRRSDARSWGWWGGFLVYLAFLPNAPYLLTDIIHLIRGVRLGIPVVLLVLIFIPLHVLAIVMGFEAYVLALINQIQYMRRQGLRYLVTWSELITHGLCAVGIFLGRFRRYNSWDLVVDPQTIFLQTLDDLTSKRPVAAIIITWVGLVVLYWIFKQITLGLVLRYRYARQGKDVIL